MTDGLSLELDELIALKRYVRRSRYKAQYGHLSLGRHFSKLRGRGIDFAEVRNYQAGDEIRHMEWRVTARTGEPHIKLYQEARERPIILLNDFNTSMYFGTCLAFKSVVAARLAATIAWTGLEQGDKVGGVFFSAEKHDEFIPRGRENMIIPLLASLSQYTVAGLENRETRSKPLSEALARVRRIMRPGSILIVISDFYTMDKESKAHLSGLRSKNDILAYHICDPLELRSPQPECYAISNGEEVLLFDTRIDGIVNAYQQYCEQRVIDLKQAFESLQIQYIQVTAETDLSLLVRQTFPRRSRG